MSFWFNFVKFGLFIDYLHCFNLHYLVFVYRFQGRPEPYGPLSVFFKVLMSWHNLIIFKMQESLERKSKDIVKCSEFDILVNFHHFNTIWRDSWSEWFTGEIGRNQKCFLFYIFSSNFDSLTFLTKKNVVRMHEVDFGIKFFNFKSDHGLVRHGLIENSLLIF